MAIRGITFSKQLVSANDDSHVFKTLLNGRKGKTRGCGMTFATDDIYVSDGYFFASNRLIEVSSTETIATPVVSSGTTYCRLVFEIDLSKTNTNAEFNQGYFKILSSTTDYPGITQEDLDNGGNVYQLPFARFTKSVSGIGSFVPELESIGLYENNSTIFVATNGNDASGDGTEAKPFATIQHAIDSIPKNLENRTIKIKVESGTYPEDVVISGFSGAPLRFEIETIAINSLHLYDSCIVIDGTKITISASGKNYGIYCHRDANAILQVDLAITGAEHGIYCGYGSRLNARKVTTINSCTFAISATFAAMIYISNLAGSKNNNGIQAAGGIVSIGSIVVAMASTLYATSNGGRVYTGAQASVPSY